MNNNVEKKKINISGEHIKEHSYHIGGMTCSACSARVEKLARETKGVEGCSVNLLKNSMVAQIDEEILSPRELEKIITESGYPAKLLSVDDIATDNSDSSFEEDSIDEEIREMKKRLILSIIFTIPLSYLAMGHMIGLPIPMWLHGKENAMAMLLAQFILTIPVVFINFKFFRIGIKTLIGKSPNMDSLVAIGSGASIVYGILSMFKAAWLMGAGDLDGAEILSMEVYFEAGAMILTLITLGKFLEARAKGKTSEAIRKLMDLTPKKANLINGDKEYEVDVSSLKIGDIVFVRSGEQVPADGVIIEGFGAVDESAITGESIPVDKAKDSHVIGGTINMSGAFKMEVLVVGKDTALAQIIKLVDDATSSKAPIEKIADRVSGIFVPIVMAIALVTFVVWILMGYGFENALLMSISVLVISCPCALGLATPTAIMVGTGVGVSRGILIKKAEALEISHKIDSVILDKTGTITKGKPKVTDFIKHKDSEEKILLTIARKIENLSEHPLGKAIVSFADSKIINSEDDSYENAKVMDFKQIEGRGLKGIVNNDLCILGNKAFMDDEKVEGFSKDILSQISKLSSEGKTVIYFAINSKLVGIFAIADTIKKTSVEAVSRLKSMGIDVVMMTGDNEQTAKAIGDKVGISDIKAGVMPKDKEELVSQLQNQGKVVAMVGDGINDAPALARADVGIAIGAGTDIAMETADIVLMRSDLRDVPTTFKLSNKVLWNIKENLFWAFIYNIIGIPIAAGLLYIPFGIRLSPMIGSMAMSISSVSVVMNALRLKLFKDENQDIEDIIYDENDEANILELDMNIYNSNMKLAQDINEKEEDQMNKIIDVRGMTCHKCVAHVKMAIEQVEGVIKADVNLGEQRATVEVADGVNDEALVAAIENAGYDVMGLR